MENPDNCLFQESVPDCISDAKANFGGENAKMDEGANRSGISNGSQDEEEEEEKKYNGWPGMENYSTNWIENKERDRDSSSNLNWFHEREEKAIALA
ncbi:hypothetical protein ACH5RR_009322 [Cinchona calisaya]|uniref:Uncharacterized protein n=1 Tax=Cinchona calisaya TaxID=153742 RepID=A0ABD3ADV3_9GENT